MRAQFLPWQALGFRLRAAHVAGEENGCRIVRAEYDPFTPGGPPDVRTLCIAPDANVVRADRLEQQFPTRRVTRITTVTRFERPPISPPAKTGLVDNGEIARVTGPNGPVFLGGRGIVSPRIVARHEPEYTEEARKAKYNTAVLLWVAVGADGTPQA